MSGYAPILPGAMPPPIAGMTWAGGSPTPPPMQRDRLKGNGPGQLQQMQQINSQRVAAGQPMQFGMPAFSPFIDPSAQMGGGGGGHGGGFGGMQHQAHMQGGHGFGSYQMPDDAVKPPPPLPGAPMNTNLQGFNRGYASDPLQSLNHGPATSWSGPSPGATPPLTKLATGGVLRPGQSAIVGDDPNGVPTGNEEVVHNMPNGNVIVQPNPNTPPPPLSPDARALIQQNKADAQTPLGYLGDVAGNIGHYAYQKLPESLKYGLEVGKGVTGMMASWPEAVGEALTPASIFPEYQKALKKETAFALRTGKSPYEQASYGAQMGPPAWNMQSGPPTSAAIQGPPAMAAMQGPPTSAATMGPPDSAKTVPQVWDDRTMMAYLAAHNAGKSDEEATQAAKRMMATNHDTSPINFAEPPGPRTAAQDNAILAGMTAQAQPFNVPPGLSPLAAQGYMEGQTHLSHTRAGREQMAATEMAKLAGISKEQRTFQNRKTLMDERYTPRVITMPDGQQVTTIMGHQIQPRGAAISQDVPQEDLGNGITRIHHGKETYIHNPAISEVPILEKQYQQVASKHEAEKAKTQKEAPLAPGLHQVPGTDYWQMVGHDHKVVSHFQGSPESRFTPFDPKAAAKPAKPSAPEMEHHVRINPDNGKAEILKLPKGAKSPPGYQKVQMEDQPENGAAPNIKSIKKV